MPKSEPERECIACRIQRQKCELFKIVRTPEKTAVIDDTGRMNGRGAYICRSEECILKAKKTKAVSRNLKISEDDRLYEELLKRITS